MNIKKVDDKPMVIHTKKKMEFHTKEPDKRSYILNDMKDSTTKKSINDEVNSATKGKRFFRNRINEANSSIKIKSQRLGVAGVAGAGAVTNQVEGGKEVNEAAGVAVAISSPVIRGARMSSGLIREAGMQIRKQKLKKVEAGKKIARRESKRVAKSSIKKVTKGTAKKVAKQTAKVATKVGTQVDTTAAGSSAGPYGMLIGAAAGKAAGDKIDSIDRKATSRMRKLKVFQDKLQEQVKSITRKKMPRRDLKREKRTFFHTFQLIT